ncbi:hypothetical protein ACIRU8_12845 [Streptomyces sp. NPDC101175]|uniref:hypothetical protein n=1 Tax=Streptomyces sp. NPDC101175 TaxID=3366123 RepID=UPI003837B345
MVRTGTPAGQDGLGPTTPADGGTGRGVSGARRQRYGPAPAMKQLREIALGAHRL